MTDGTDAFTLLGPLSGSNSGRTVVGTALSATASDLIFNFSAGGTQYALFQSPSSQFYCVQTTGCFDFGGPGEAISPRTNTSRSSKTGSVVLASSGSSSVPEPATWSTFVLGGALLAARVRSSRRGA